ncbi:DeoR/GlpR transcriptional regulator [Cellulomonas sp. Sa3CUA2]|uniref:Lactose phosphotransferase system repressor n=1 Tax=Cellulomonas avistercoris TaxID=2762242 RepID=A0ABR8QGP5_9CELL|nr:DeoR/GlpR family DNA-binding transcription regulator [Cellulomonas avistercoris]MBD7919610.1 DeoR/GlpR transcriptional regulator [Cellulomonas avistercoris]
MAHQPTDPHPGNGRRLPAGRQAELAQHVASAGEVTVAELSERFGVSMDTVRRDLDRLHADGVLVRTHGGAMVATGQARPDRALGERMVMQSETKEAIGAAAARLVTDHSAVVVGSGTTTLAAARHLQQHRGLIVVTNNLLLPGVLPREAVRDVYLLGGAVRIAAQATVGPVVFGGGGAGERTIRCDLALVGVGGVDAEMGVSTSHVGEAETMAEMMRISRRVAVLADATKFDQVLFSQIADLSVIDYLVTDTAPRGALARALEAAEVEVVLPH